MSQKCAKRRFLSESFVGHEGPPLAGRQGRHQNTPHSDPFEAYQPQARIFNDACRIPRLVPFKSHAQTGLFGAFAADACFKASGAHCVKLIRTDRAMNLSQHFMLKGLTFVLEFAQYVGVF